MILPFTILRRLDCILAPTKDEVLALAEYKKLQNLKVGDHEHIATAKRMKADGHTGKNIAKHRGVSSAMIYRYLSEDGSA